MKIAIVKIVDVYNQGSDDYNDYKSILSNHITEWADVTEEEYKILYDYSRKCKWENQFTIITQTPIKSDVEKDIEDYLKEAKQFEKEIKEANKKREEAAKKRKEKLEANKAERDLKKLEKLKNELKEKGLL